MAMQYDVKSAYTAADAAMVAYPVRVKGAYISSAAGGSTPVTFYDNASAASGTVLFKISVSAAGSHTVVIPGEGVRALNGVFCDTGSADAVTIFYG